MRNVSSRSLFALISLGLLAACGGTSKNTDDDAAGRAGAGGATHAGSGNGAGTAGTLAGAGRGGTGNGGSTSVSMPTPTCDDPPAMLGSCYSGSQCAEGTNEFAASVTNRPATTPAGTG